MSSSEADFGLVNFFFSTALVTAFFMFVSSLKFRRDMFVASAVMIAIFSSIAYFDQSKKMETVLIVLGIASQVNLLLEFIGLGYLLRIIKRAENGSKDAKDLVLKIKDTPGFESPVLPCMVQIYPIAFFLSIVPLGFKVFLCGLCLSICLLVVYLTSVKFHSRMRKIIIDS